MSTIPSFYLLSSVFPGLLVVVVGNMRECNEGFLSDSSLNISEIVTRTVCRSLFSIDTNRFFRLTWFTNPSRSGNYS